MKIRNLERTGIFPKKFLWHWKIIKLQNVDELHYSVNLKVHD